MLQSHVIILAHTRLMALLCIHEHVTQRANHPVFMKTDMACCKRLLYMVRFLRPPPTTSGWTTFSTGYCNSEIQDGVQDGRRTFKSSYYHQLLLYFHVQYSLSMVFEVRESIYDGFRVI